MGKIKITVLEGLNADDVLKLHAGGFFGGEKVALPSGVTGQEAVLVRPGDTIALRAAQQVALGKVAVEAEVLPGGYDANVREALERSEAAQLAAVEAIKEKAEAKATRRRREREEDRAVERAANAAAEPAPAPEAAPEPPKPAEAAAAPETAPQEAAPVSSGDEPSIDTMVTFSKLRDLLAYLTSCGIPEDGLVTFCEQVAEHVPLLKRINIATRIPQTLAVKNREG